MPKPWEKYGKPWEKYGGASSTPDLPQSGYASPRLAIPTSSDISIPRTLSQFGANAWKGVGDFASGISSMVTSPMKTAEAIGESITGGVPIPSSLPDEIDYATAARSSKVTPLPAVLADYASSRYGSPSKLATTAFEDPIGMGMDIASIAAPIGGSARVAARAPRLARAAELTAKIADPISTATTAAVSRTAPLASRAAESVQRTADLRQPGRMFDPKEIYRRALGATSSKNNPAAALAEIQAKTDTGWNQRVIPGSKEDFDRIEKLRQDRIGTRNEYIASKDEPVWLGDVTAETGPSKAHYGKQPSSAAHLEAIRGAEQTFLQTAAPDQGMRSFGPVPERVGMEIAPTPPRLGPPQAVEANIGRVPSSRQIEQAPIPLPPPSGPTQIAFDPKIVHEPTFTQPPGQAWVDLDQPGNIEAVFGSPSRHLEGEPLPPPSRPEPVTPAPRDMVDSTRDMQTRGVLKGQGFTNEGYRSTTPLPPLPESASLAARGVQLERPIIPETPQGTISRAPEDARRSLQEIEQAITAPEFSSLPAEHQLAIHRQADSLRQQLATTGSEPFINSQRAEALKEGAYQEAGDRAFDGRIGPDIDATRDIGRGLKKELERVYPGIDLMNADIGELTALLPDLGARVQDAWRGTGPSATTGAAAAVGSGVVFSPTAAVPVGAAAGIRSLMHHPGARARLAFWIYDQMHKPPGGLARTAQELEAAFRAAPKAELARISARLEQALVAEEGASGANSVPPLPATAR